MSDEARQQFLALMESGSASEATALWLSLFKKLAVKDQGALACKGAICTLQELFGLLGGPVAFPAGAAKEARTGILQALAARLLDSGPTEGPGGGHFQMVDRDLAMQVTGDLDGRIVEDALSQEHARRQTPDADAMIDEGDPNTD